MKREMRLGRHLTCKRDGQALRSEKRSSQQSAETVAWNKKIVPTRSCRNYVAGETRLEHATGGFGDRCSTVEPLP